MASVVLDPRGEPDRSVAVIRKPQTQKDITGLNMLVCATFPLVAFNSLCTPKLLLPSTLPPSLLTRNLNINMGAGGAFRPSPGGSLPGLPERPWSWTDFMPHGGQGPNCYPLGCMQVGQRASQTS